MRKRRKQSKQAASAMKSKWYKWMIGGLISLPILLLTGYFYVIFNFSQHENAAATISGRAINTPTQGGVVILEYTSQPVPMCDATVSFFVEDADGRPWPLKTLFFDAQSHQDFVNLNGPDKPTTFSGVPHKLPANLGPGDYEFQITFRYNCGILGGLFPQVYKAPGMPFTIAEKQDAKED